jgi:eukaryotic-like serine/threonine-protein kinase
VSASRVSERTPLGLATAGVLRIVRPAMKSGTGAADDDAGSSPGADEVVHVAPGTDAGLTAATVDGVPERGLVGVARPGLTPGDETRTAASRAADAMPAASDRVPAPLQRRDPDRYEIVAEHGRGGLGRVFRAHDKELGRDVAVKELLQRTHRSEVRFFREALITARLEHPGIVPVHEAGRWPDGTPFYAMKLVAGRPLSELISEATTLEQRLALLPHVIAVANAIAYAHDRRIIHRDLKPSNVIVGDFGETVVIDWGLAKQLDEQEATVSDQGPYRNAATDALTVAGSVLGTPAYMAPEQARGEADERSDVFSIGAMLDHVVTGRVPDRTGRANKPEGVPRDLAAILDRATATEPARRYASVKDLADDLRRFRQREPVAARRYSLASRAVLGFARNRTIALSASVALVVISLMLGVSVFAISRKQAQEAAARRDAEDGRKALVLMNAELLLAVDPTAAHAILTDRDAPASLEADLIRSQARGRGISPVSMQLHTDAVLLLSAASGGLVSATGEPEILFTRDEAAVTLVSDSQGIPLPAISALDDRVVYSTTSGVKVQRLGNRTIVTVDHVGHPKALAISADGSRVAIASDDMLTIHAVASVSEELARWRVSAVKQISFDHNSRIVLTTPSHIHVYTMGVASPLVLPSFATGWGLDSRHNRVAAGGLDGTVMLAELHDLRAVTFVPVCNAALNAVRLQDDSSVAYACQDGAFGIWNFETETPVVRRTMNGAALVLDASEDGRYAVFGGDDRDVYLFDAFSRTVSRFRGHAAAVTTVLAPGARFPNAASADANGVLRTWPTPDGHSRVALRASGSIYHTIFSHDSSMVVVDGFDGHIRVYDLERGMQADVIAHPTLRPIYGVRTHPSRREYLAWGDDGAIYFSRDQSWTQGHVGGVRDMEYLADGSSVSVGVDGRVLLWTHESKLPQVWHHHSRPLHLVEVVGDDGAVIADDRGRLLVLLGDGGLRELSEFDQGPLATLKVGARRERVAAGSKSGVVSILEFGRAESRELLRTQGSIRHVAFSPDDAALAIVSEDGNIYIAELNADVAAQVIPIRARSVAFSADGSLLAITCAEGSIWFYGVEDRSWYYREVHQGDVLLGSFSPDSQWYASGDSSGEVIVHNISGIRGMLPRTSNSWRKE